MNTSIFAMLLGFISATIPKIIHLCEKIMDHRQERVLLTLNLEADVRRRTLDVDYALLQRGIVGSEVPVDVISSVEDSRNDQRHLLDRSRRWLTEYNAAIRPSMAAVAMMLIVMLSIAALWSNPGALMLLKGGLVVDFVLYVCGYFLGQRSMVKR